MGQVAAKHADLVHIRGMKPTERNMVCDNWVRSYESAERPRGVERDVWVRGHRRVVNQLVDECTVGCAYYTVNPNYPLGWIAYDIGRGLIHYVFVRHELRTEFGVGGMLIDLAVTEIDRPIVFATHVTRIGRAIIRRRDWLKYDPWALSGVT